jgi:hypothetical protein
MTPLLPIELGKPVKIRKRKLTKFEEVRTAADYFDATSEPELEGGSMEPLLDFVTTSTTTATSTNVNSSLSSEGWVQQQQEAEQQVS